MGHTRLQNYLLRSLFSAAIILLSVVGCSKSKESTTPSVIPGAGYGYPSEQGTTPFADSSDGGSLFDSSISKDPLPATSTTTALPAATQPTQQCLSSDSGFGLGGSFGDPYGSSSRACFDPSYSNPWDEAQFYQFGIESYDRIRRCNEYVSAAAPATTASVEEVHSAFIKGKLALIRCFRMILKHQTQYAPWDNAVGQGMNYNDGMYYFMLVQLGQNGQPVTQYGSTVVHP